MDTNWEAIHDSLIPKFKKADLLNPAIDLSRPPRLVKSSWRENWPDRETTVSPGKWRTSKVERERETVQCLLFALLLPGWVCPLTSCATTRPSRRCWTGWAGPAYRATSSLTTWASWSGRRQRASGNTERRETRGRYQTGWTGTLIRGKLVLALGTYLMIGGGSGTCHDISW